MKDFKTFLLITTATAFLFQACSDSTSSADIDYQNITEISYNKHINPLLREYKVILEENLLYPEGLEINSWNNLIKGWVNGEVLIAYDAENSLLIKLTEKLNYANKLDSVKLAILKRWIDEGAQNSAGEVPYKKATNLVYVCNQGAGTISIIDTQELLVIRTIKLNEYGFSSSSKPHHIAVEPDGSSWYVSLIADGKVLKFDEDNNFVGAADTPTPGLLALHPTINKLYAGRSMTAPNPPSSLISIDKQTMQVTEIPLAFARPHALLVQSNGKFVYTASLVENKMAVIDANSDEVEETIALTGDNPVYVHFAESADNAKLFATGQVSNSLLVFDTDINGSLTFNTAIGVGQAPWHPVLGKDLSSLYFGNKVSNSVSVVNITTNQVSTTITSPAISAPHGSAISSDGRYLFISNQNTNGLYTPYYPFGDAKDTGTVIVIDTQTNTVVKTLEVGKTPSGVGA